MTRVKPFCIFSKDTKVESKQSVIIIVCFEWALVSCTDYSFFFTFLVKLKYIFDKQSRLLVNSIDWRENYRSDTASTYGMLLIYFLIILESNHLKKFHLLCHILTLKQATKAIDAKNLVLLKPASIIKVIYNNSR